MAKNGTNHQSYPLIDPKDLRFFLTVIEIFMCNTHYLTNFFYKVQVYLGVFCFCALQKYVFHIGLKRELNVDYTVRKNLKVLGSIRG